MNFYPYAFCVNAIFWGYKGDYDRFVQLKPHILAAEVDIGRCFCEINETFFVQVGGHVKCG